MSYTVFNNIIIEFMGSPNGSAPGGDTLPRTGMRRQLVVQDIDTQETLDPAAIRRHLEEGIQVRELPAIAILASQLDRSYRYIRQSEPDMSTIGAIHTLVTLFNSRGFYQRISEQAIFGPREYERTENLAQLEGDMPRIQKGITAAEKNILEQRSQMWSERENGWLYMNQGRRGKTVYRIYLSPQALSIGDVFEAIALEIPESVGYQMKTFDSPGNAHEVARLDKIIVYCSEGSFDPIMAAVGRVHTQYRDAFKGRYGPGGGAMVPLEGISVAKQSQERDGLNKVTGTKEAATRVQRSLEKTLPRITRETFKRFPTVNEASESEEALYLWNAMLELKDTIVKYNLFFPDRPDKEIVDDLVREYMAVNFFMLLDHYVNSKSLRADEMRMKFLDQIHKKRIPLTPGQYQYIENPSLTIYDAGTISTRIEGMTERTGLMLAFHRGLEEGRDPGEVFVDLF
jgi:hypothetical protein